MFVICRFAFWIRLWDCILVCCCEYFGLVVALCFLLLLVGGFWLFLVGLFDLVGVMMVFLMCWC